jgi:hypothetical protein
MKVAGKSLVILLLVGIFIASCAPRAPEEPVEQDIAASLTAGVGTIVAYFFETQTALAPPASMTPSITPLPEASSSPIVFPTLGSVASPTTAFVFASPTPTGTYYTATPNAGSLAYGCNNLAFIRDVSLPNGTVLEPNEPFTRTWKVSNNGTCDWLYGYRLVPVSGFQLASDPIGVHNAPVPPGEWREFSVGARAPDDAGTYTQYWQMSDGAGHTFGATLSISIIVRAPTNTPNPTNTPQPTSTATATATATIPTP